MWAQAQALSRMEASLAEVYRSNQQRALEASTWQGSPCAGPCDELGGTTALVAILMGDMLHIANIGDCRAVLCRRNMEGQPVAIPLSTDHTPNLEIARIKATGFEVSHPGSKTCSTVDLLLAPLYSCCMNVLLGT